MVEQWAQPVRTSPTKGGSHEPEKSEDSVLGCPGGAVLHPLLPV